MTKPKPVKHDCHLEEHICKKYHGGQPERDDWIFKISVRGAGFVCWFKEKSRIFCGNSRGCNYIQIDNPDFIEALNIAKKYENKWVYVFPRTKNQVKNIPENFEVR